MFRKKTTLSEYPQTLCKKCDQAAPPPGGPKAGACGRRVEELAFTSGPAQFGRGLWGNSQKKLEKDEEGTRHGVQGGLARHREGTWGLGWGGGGGRNRSKQRHRMLQPSHTLLSWPPSSPAHGECSECDELIRSGLPLHLARSTGAGVLCPIPLIREGFWGVGKFSMDIILMEEAHGGCEGGVFLM